MFKPKYELFAAYSICLFLMLINFTQNNDVTISIVFMITMFLLMFTEHRRKISYLTKLTEIETSARQFYTAQELKFISTTMVESDERIGRHYNSFLNHVETMNRYAKRNQQIINLVTTNSDSPIVILNVKGEFEYANQSFRHWVELPLLKKVMVNDIKSLVLKEVLQNALINEERRVEFMSYNQSHYQVVCNPIFDENHVFSGTIVSFHDVTDLKKYQTLQKEFFASVSHELKTPISAIKGCTELLLNGAKEDNVILEEFLTIIQDENNRMEQLVQNLMLLNRYEFEHVQIQSDIISLNELLASCLLDVSTLATLKSQKISIQSSEEVAVIGDSIQLKLCFANLLTNAIHYSSEDKEIVVKMKTEQHEVKVSVIDQGVGIAQQDLAHIFERFYRVDKARSRQTGGTGLGLSLVKSIVQAHGGAIDVKSELDKGTIVTVTLKIK